MPFEKPVIHIMTENPATLHVGEPLSKARELFADGRINHLPIVENGKLAGILSSNDLVKLSFLVDDEDHSLSDFLDRQYTVAEVMQSNPVSISVESTVREAAQILAVAGFHALPVIGKDRSLKGIVTSTDLIELLLERLG